VAREVWSPRRKMSGQARLVHGWVEYDQELTLHQIWTYELWPQDVEKQAKMAFTQGGILNENAYEYWMSQDVKDLKRLYAARDEQKAWAALVLMGEIDQPF